MRYRITTNGIQYRVECSSFPFCWDVALAEIGHDPLMPLSRLMVPVIRDTPEECQMWINEQIPKKPEKWRVYQHLFY